MDEKKYNVCNLPPITLTRRPVIRKRFKIENDLAVLEKSSPFRNLIIRENSCIDIVKFNGLTFIYYN